MIADVFRYLPPNAVVIARRVIVARPPVSVHLSRAAAILGWSVQRLHHAISVGRVPGAFLDDESPRPLWVVPLPVTVLPPVMGHGVLARGQPKMPQRANTSKEE